MRDSLNKYKYLNSGLNKAYKTPYFRMHNLDVGFNDFFARDFFTVGAFELVLRKLVFATLLVFDFLTTVLDVAFFCTLFFCEDTFFAILCGICDYTTNYTKCPLKLSTNIVKSL